MHKKLNHWVRDYIYLAHKQSQAFIFRKPPTHYLGHIEEKKANSKITSIYGEFDNHVWPESSCRLEGAENIQVETHGHHRMLGDKRVISAVLEEVGR